MSCPYSEEQLQLFDSVANPIGDACRTCDECDCEHWEGSCPEDCQKTDKWPECGGPWSDKYAHIYAGEEKSASEVLKK